VCGGQVIHPTNAVGEKWVQYRFGLTCSGPFTLSIRYADDWPARPFMVGVNTESGGFGNPNFGAATGGWTEDAQLWTPPVQIPLRKGQNTIRLFALNGRVYGTLPYISEISLAWAGAYPPGMGACGELDPNDPTGTRCRPIAAQPNVTTAPTPARIPATAPSVARSSGPTQGSRCATADGTYPNPRGSEPIGTDCFVSLPSEPLDLRGKVTR
jgi:hypothetical protein